MNGAVRRFLEAELPDALALLSEEPLLRTAGAEDAVRDWMRTFQDDPQSGVALAAQERLAYLEFSNTAPSPTAAMDLHQTLSELVGADDDAEAAAVVDARPELCSPAGRAVARIAFLAAATRVRERPDVVEALRAAEMFLAQHCVERTSPPAAERRRPQPDHESVVASGPAPGSGAAAHRWPVFPTIAQLVEAAEAEADPWRTIQLCLLALFRLDPLDQRAGWASIRQRLSAVTTELVTTGTVEQQRHDIDEDSDVDWDNTGFPEAEREAMLGLHYLVEADGPAGSNAIDSAITALLRARDTLDAARAPTLAMVVERHLGIAYAMRRSASPAADAQRSLEQTEAALRIAPAGHQRAACLISLSNALCDLVTADRHDALTRAIAHATEAAESWWGLGDIDRWAGAQHTLGVIHQAFGDDTHRSRAIDAYYRALSVPPGGRASGSWGLVEWATTLNNLAAGLLATEGEAATAQIERAIGYLTVALTVRLRDRRPVDWAASHHNLGLAYSMRSVGFPAANARRAVTHLETALEVRRADSRPGEWLETISLLGAVRHEQDQHGAALALYREGLAVFSRDEAPLQHAGLLINIGNVYVDTHNRGDPAALVAAIDAYSDALDLAESAGERRRARHAARSLGNAHARRRAWADAAAAYRRAVALDGTLYRLSVTLRGRETELEWASGLYAKLAVTLARAGQPRSAVEAAEAGRARALGAALRRGQAEWDELARTHPAEQAAYSDAAQRLDEAEAAERAFRAENATSSPELRDELARLHDATQQAHDALTAADAVISALPSTAHLITAPDINGLLAAIAPGTAVVYLLNTDLGTMGLIAEAHHVELVDLPQLTEATITRFLAQTSDGAPPTGLLGGLIADDSHLGAVLGEAIERVIDELGSKLMRPVADSLREQDVRAVTLVPGGRLAALPLHACVIRTGDSGEHRHFCDEFTVSYAPSATVLHYAAARRRTQPGHGVLSAIDPELSTAPLEQHILSRLFPQAHQITAPTPEQLLDAATGTDLVHLVCHGELDLDRPLQSGFHMAERLLSLEQLLATRAFAGVGLVITTACSSAAVHVAERPDEVVSLPSGLLHAGASTVVGALWPIDDGVGTLFTGKFLELTTAGHSPADALARTQRWLRTARKDDLRHFVDATSTGAPPESVDDMLEWLSELTGEHPLADPLDWAPFVLVGAHTQR